MILEVLDSRKRVEWDGYVHGHPAATCYHASAWQQIAEEAYGIESPFLLAREAEGAPIRGILPLFVVRSPVRTHLSNGLFGAYGKILADTAEIRTELLHAAMDVLHDHRISQLVLKVLDDEKLEREGFLATDCWVIAQLPLDPDPDRLWNGLRDKIRNCVRKGVRSGLVARTGHEHLVDFYSVLRANMHAKGAPVYGLPFLRQLLIAFEEQAEVLTVWHGKKCVAGALLLEQGKTVYVPFASSLPSALSLSPNNFLYWEIIRRSSLRGMKVLDFGRSTRDTGALAFKLGWGAVTRPQFCHIYSPRITPVQPNLRDPRAENFVWVWKRAPKFLTDRIGPNICRWLAGLL